MKIWHKPDKVLGSDCTEHLIKNNILDNSCGHVSLRTY